QCCNATQGWGGRFAPEWREQRIPPAAWREGHCQSNAERAGPGDPGPFVVRPVWRPPVQPTAGTNDVVSYVLSGPCVSFAFRFGSIAAVAYQGHPRFDSAIRSEAVIHSRWQVGGCLTPGHRTLKEGTT